MNVCKASRRGKRIPVTHKNTLFLSLKTQNGACSLLPLAMGWVTVTIQSWV